MIGDAYSKNREDRYNIDLSDVFDSFWTFLDYLNPLSWLRYFVTLIYGYDPLDVFYENKNDEEHYYKNS